MARKKTHEEYVAQVAKINPNIEVIGTFVNSRVKILHKCRIDGYEWMVDPNHIVAGTGCPLCAGKIKTTKSFIKELNQINNTIEVLGEYINGHTKILCRCKIDGYEWEPLPINLLRGSGCPFCSGVNHKTHIEYVNEVKRMNDNIEVLGTYINAKTQILHRCKKDGTIWLSDPHHILSGRGCPKCNISYGEKAISDYLDGHNITFKSQYTFLECKNVFCLPFDFYLPDYNACIEYDGQQHFMEIDFFGGKEGYIKRKRNDSIKNVFCEDNNILLLRIKYNENIVDVLNNFFNKLTIQN